MLVKGFTATVYPKKYAHGFCFAVLCCGYTLTDFPISIRLTSLALWQSNDCPSASKATLMNMDKYFTWIHYERLHNHNKAKHNKTVCIFLGIYCMNPLGAVLKGMDRASDVSSSAMNMGQITLLRDTYGLLNVSVYSLFPQGRAQQSILWGKQSWQLSPLYENTLMFTNKISIFSWILKLHISNDNGDENINNKSHYNNKKKIMLMPMLLLLLLLPLLLLLLPLLLLLLLLLLLMMMMMMMMINNMMPSTMTMMMMVWTMTMIMIWFL